MKTVIRQLKNRVWTVLAGQRFRTALEQNEHAAAELDAVVREVLQK